MTCTGTGSTSFFDLPVRAGPGGGTMTATDVLAEGRKLDGAAILGRSSEGLYVLPGYPNLKLQRERLSLSSWNQGRPQLGPGEGRISPEGGHIEEGPARAAVDNPGEDSCSCSDVHHGN